MKTDALECPTIDCRQGGASDCMGEKRPIRRRAAPVILAAILAAGALAIGAGDTGQPPTPGRYTILQCQTVEIASGTSRTIPIVLRLDTSTGKTWTLHGGLCSWIWVETNEKK